MQIKTKIKNALNYLFNIWPHIQFAENRNSFLGLLQFLNFVLKYEWYFWYLFNSVTCNDNNACKVKN